MALGAVIAAFFGLKNKNTILNLINKNQAVINEVETLAAKVDTNEGSIKVEEQARNDIQKNVDEINKQKATQEQLLSFFNQGPKK